MPSAAAPSRSACSAMRFRSRQVICRTGSTPLRTRKCAAARLDMCALDPAPSVTLIAVTSPRNASAWSMNSAGSVDTGGESSAVTTKLPSCRCLCSSLMALLDDCSFVAASVARRASASALSLCLDSSHEFRRLLPQAIVRHAPASRHVVVREPPRRLAHFLWKALVPVRARVRRGEQFFHDRPALALERRERARHVLARLAERPVERDRVLEREARSGTDREMHGAQRIPDQDELSR